MKISIIIPTYNNLKFLKFCLSSIKKNSYYNHEIILHVNEGSDGTTNFVKENKLIHTHSIDNIGLCSSINKAFSLVTTNHILYNPFDFRSNFINTYGCCYYLFRGNFFVFCKFIS